MSTILVVNKSLEIYIPKKINGIRIRSKCDWYENGEKSTKFFLNLEKYSATQGCLRTIIVNKKEINDSRKALTSIDNDKSPGNDGITKEFYIKFWDAVKEPLCASIQ